VITSFVTQEFTTLDISAIVWAIPGIIFVYDFADRERRAAQAALMAGQPTAA
jgi:hypothetical protein